MNPTVRTSLPSIIVLALTLVATVTMAASTARPSLGVADASLFQADYNKAGYDKEQIGFSQPIPVILQLAGQPTLRTYADNVSRSSSREATAQAQIQLARLQSEQKAVLGQISAPVLFQVQRVYNGIAILIPPDELNVVAEIPGVAAVHHLPTYTPAGATLSAIQEVPPLQNSTLISQLTGKSITIGVVDTGIDYLHADLGGPGEHGVANDTSIISDSVAGIRFPTAKVVGGYDFVGDGYNGKDKNVPDPDPDPMDCWGHGTHVAGIAAGNGLLRNGIAYHGPYPSNLPPDDFTITPGVAPEAELYALKIFGCSGISNMAVAAIEWAVDPDEDGDFSDRLDVLNLSLGSPFGAEHDPGVEALENAAQTGMVVVAAAGNGGNVVGVTASPAIADHAISVASVTELANIELSGQKDRYEVQSLSSFTARGPRRPDSMLKPDIAAPGNSIRSAAAGTGTGSSVSSGTSMATPYISGIAALLRERYPDWRSTEIKALLLNTARHTPLASAAYPPIYQPPVRTGTGRVNVAAAGDASLLVFNADDPGLVNLSFGAPLVSDSYYAIKNMNIVNKSEITHTLIADYTPVLDQSGVAVAFPDGRKVTIPPGARSSVPILLSVDPDSMETVHDPTLLPTGSWPRHRLSEEMGYLHFWPAETVVQSAWTGNTISGTLTMNLDATSGSISYSAKLTASEPSRLQELALRYEDTTLHSLLDGNGNSAGNTITTTSVITASGAVTLSGQERLWLTDGLLDAVVETSPLSRAQQHSTELVHSTPLLPAEPVLRLALYAAPRAAARTEPAQTVLDYTMSPTGTQVLTLTGEGLLTAGSLEETRFPTDTVSLVSVLELQASSVNELASAKELNHADLRHIGVTTDLPAELSTSGRLEAVNSARLLFGVAMHGSWLTPNGVTVRVDIDVDEDGEADFALYNSSYGALHGRGPTDEFVSVMENLETGEKTLTYPLNVVAATDFDTAVYNNSVMLLGLDAGTLGLSAQNSDISYLVSTESRDTIDNGRTLDRSGPHYYDLARPGLLVGGNRVTSLPLFYDLPGTFLSVTADREAFYSNRSKGLLLLHHHNAASRQASVVVSDFRWLLFLPAVSMQ